MATNLELQKALNDLLEEANVLLTKQTKILQTQSQIMSEMVKAQQVLTNTNHVDEFDELADALEAAATAAEHHGQAVTDIEKMRMALEKELNEARTLTEVWDVLEKGMRQKYGPAFDGARNAVTGFSEGLSFSTNMMRNFVSFGGDVIKVLTNIGISILMVPFKILSNLINSVGSGSTELAEAIEKVREEFGYLNKTAGGATMQMFRSMRGELANTGLSVYRVFGSLAERLRYLTEYIKTIEKSFDALNFTLGQGGAEALGAYNKGLGLTQEGQKAIAARALATGQSINEVNRQIANYGIQLSRQFGVTQKLVTRAVGDMLADFEHFGHLGPKALTQVAVYARKLGIEVKALAGILDKTLNFEDAATQAAQLSQAFGLNIDALQQMREQDPAKQLDNLRKAFFAAGRSVESMTRQERALLAQQTGLDAASIDAAFSLKNQAMSYDQIQRKGEAARRTQLSQAEAMRKLAGAIERMIKQGDFGKGGFFDRFFQGFDAGMRRTREWRMLMRSLRIDLRSTFYAGRQVGRMFMQMFPGIRDVFRGIQQLFEPRRFREMLRKVVSAFRDFFQDMTTNPRQALPKLLERLQKGFFDWFKDNSGPGRRLLDGFRKFFKAMGTIFNSLFKIAVTNLTKGIQYVADLITGKEKLPTMNVGNTTFLTEILATLIDGIGPILTQLWEAVKNLLSALWEKARPELMKLLPYALAAMFGPAIIGAAMRGVGSLIASTLTAAIVEGLAKPAAARLIGVALTKLGQNIPRTAINIPQNLPNATETIAQTQEKAEGIKLNWSFIGKLLFIAAVVTVGIAAIAAATIYLIRRFNVTKEEVLKTVMLVGAVGAIALAVSASVLLLSMFPTSAAGNAMAGIGMAMLVVLAMGAAGSLVVAMIRAWSFSNDDVLRAVQVMGVLGTLFFAASAVALVGAAIGTAVYMTGGIGAAVIIGGVAFLALITTGMVDHAMTIMDKLKKFTPSPAFETTTKAFVDIIKAISEFGSAIAAIVSAATPGLFTTIGSLWPWRNPQKELNESLGKIVQIINVMGNKIKEIVESLNGIVGTGVTPQQIEKGRLLGDLLNSVGNLAKSLVPSDTLLSDPGFWSRLLGADDVTERIAQLNTYIQTVTTSLISLAIRVNMLLRGLATLDVREHAVRAAQMFATMIGALGQLAKSLSPDENIVKAFIKGDYSRFLVPMSRYVENVIGGLVRSNIIQTVGGQIKELVTQLGEIEIEKARVLERIAPLIGPIFSAIATVGEVARSAATFRTDSANPATLLQAARVLEAQQHAIAQFFESARTMVTSVVNTLSSLGGNISPQRARVIKAYSEALGPILSAIGGLPQILSSFTTKAQGDTRTNVQVLEGKVTELASLFGTTGESPFLTGITSLSIGLDRIASNFGNIRKGSLDKMKLAFDTIAVITSILQTFTGTTISGNIVGTVNRALVNVSKVLTAFSQPFINYNGESIANPFVAGPGSIQAMFRNFVVTKGFVAKLQGAQHQITNINTVAKAIAEMPIDQNLANNLASKVFQTGVILSVMKAKLGHLNDQLEEGDYASEIADLTANIRTAGFSRVSAAVRGMVSDLNSVSQDLARLGPIDIDSNLRRLAHDLGLEQVRDFTINRGRINLTINSKVTIDSADLEYVLINRANSVWANLRSRYQR